MPQTTTLENIYWRKPKTKFLKKLACAKAAWMPPVWLRHQGCAVSQTEDFCLLFILEK
ncbi:hypothetical protein [uncultured Acinetobacter sp.]|uniref:hypothetical protein n=1 Tax=uncultured Acinetobacter sp. TaxID=165433 RepID=UPI00258AE166|nr:hypothetical protein [uncultured Acinetobacter sp.]